MEENIAILIADLSGYTALTEAHGAASAADLVDQYTEMVNDCLVGDSRLHERTGDEVMIVSRSVDDLSATAELLMKKAIATENFLQLHGGMHYGKALKRNGSYFGTTINLASRIAAKAGAGQFLYSDTFIQALKEPGSFSFSTAGHHAFKNLPGSVEIYRQENSGREEEIFIDPVCKMQVRKTRNAISHPSDKNIFFCSVDCLEHYHETAHVH